MRYFTIPSDLTTLAHARPGMELEVRHVLGCARRGVQSFEPGDRIVCRHVNGQGLIVTTADGGDVNVPWDAARCLQVERVEADEAEGEPPAPSSLRLLAAGPVTRMLARHGGRRARSLTSDHPTATLRRTVAEVRDRRPPRMAGGHGFPWLANSGRDD